MNIMTFSLAMLDKEANSNQGAKMHVKSPVDGSPAYLDDECTKPVTINFLGTSSDVAKKASIKKARQAIKENKKKRNQNDIPDDVLDKKADEDSEYMAALATGWEGILDEKGKAIPFSKDAALKVFRQFSGLRDQINEFLVDDANFIQS